LLAAVIVLGLGALFLLFVLLFSQRVASHSCETLRVLLHHPFSWQPISVETMAGLTVTPSEIKIATI